MARIRSTHPGQWKDGDFLECSPMARLLCLAIRNIADDRGAFRWKPKTIKAECLPGDNCDIEALLSELVENDQVVKYENDGKSYGLILDFTQWQRPKKPTATHPIPEPVRNEHGLIQAECDTSSEPVPNQYRNCSAEVGGRREEVGGTISSLRSDIDYPAVQEPDEPPAKPAPKPRRKPETDLPENVPDAQQKAEASAYWREQGLGLNVDLEAAQFRDYCRQHGKRYRDWGAAWRTRYRNAAKFAKERAAERAPPDTRSSAGVLKWGRK